MPKYEWIRCPSCGKRNILANRRNPVVCYYCSHPDAA